MEKVDLTFSKEQIQAALETLPVVTGAPEKDRSFVLIPILLKRFGKTNLAFGRDKVLRAYRAAHQADSDLVTIEFEPRLPSGKREGSSEKAITGSLKRGDMKGNVDRENTNAASKAEAMCVDCGKSYKQLPPFFETVRVGKRCAECSNKAAARYARAKWCIKHENDNIETS